MKISFLFLTSVILLLTGCSASHLVYVQETSLGVNLGLSAEGTQKLSIGYDRDVYSIVPKKDDNGDAMSLLSVNDVSIEGMDDMKVSEFVAGGEPAKVLAKDPNAVNKLREKVYGSKGEQ